MRWRSGAQCSTALAVREQHGRDEGSIRRRRLPPWCLPSTQDVQDAVRLAAQYACR
jgi:D-lactate dehydrogenase (cytochrome)